DHAEEEDERVRNADAWHETSSLFAERTGEPPARRDGRQSIGARRVDPSSPPRRTRRKREKSSPERTQRTQRRGEIERFRRWSSSLTLLCPSPSLSVSVCLCSRARSRARSRSRSRARLCL